MLETRAAGYVAGLKNVAQAAHNVVRHIQGEAKENAGLAVTEDVDVQAAVASLDAAIEAMQEMQAAFVTARKANK